jgi:hypothetical protein
MVGKPLVELVEVLRDDESVVPDVAAIDQRERVSFVGLLFGGKIHRESGLIVGNRSIQHVKHLFSKGAEVARRSGVVGIGVGLHPSYNAAQRLYVKRGYIPDARGITYITEDALWKRAHAWCLTMTS